MDLSDKFDVLILGTGLLESIIAAAASRAGKSVLHLDQNDYYGSEWTSLTFRQVDKWIKGNCENASSLVSNIEVLKLFTDKWSEDELEKIGNKINIDLCPRFIYSSGPMVDLLVKSNISRYLEFINCHKLYFLKDDGNSLKCFPIPSSRSNIFTSKDLTIIQKRRLTKFIENYAQRDLNELTEVSLKKIMDDENLDQELQAITKTILVMKSEACLASEAIKSLRQFMASVGRYGDTPFLWTLAGSGELPQAFCRLSAVFGGTYCLDTSPTEIQFSDNEVKFNFKGAQKSSQFVVGSIADIDKNLINIPSNFKRSSHVACLTNKSLTSNDEGRTSFLRMEGATDGINVIELGPSSWCVPKGLYLVHISCLASSDTSKEDLMPVIERLFSVNQEPCEKPNLIWALFYNMSFIDQNVASNFPILHVVDGPVFEMDYEKCINEAKVVFDKMFPGEDFLPKAPDAEDIVIEGDNGSNV